MIIILVLFFSLSTFSMQRYADRPDDPNPNDPKKNNNPTHYNPSELFYNPNNRVPVFVNPHEQKNESLTARRVIFSGTGNGNSQNVKKQNRPFVYAQIELRSIKNIETFNDIIKNYFTSDLVLYYQNNHFYWKKNQQQSGNFDSLANAITHASQKTFQGYLPINNDLIESVLKGNSYSTLTPSQPFDQIKKNDWFILWITTPNITKNKQIALTIALANSRLRDIKEGAYAILSQFNYRLAQELSRKKTQDTTELITTIEPYITQQNLSKINQILKEQGDPNYLEKLKNSEIKSSTYMHILPILLHLYALASTGTFLYTVFKNKKIPSFRNNFIKKSLFFISVLANGYLIKNIFNQLYLLKYPNKETDEIY